MRDFWDRPVSKLEGGGLALRSRFGEAWASVAGFLESGQKRLSRRLRPTRRRTGLHPFVFGGRGRPPSMSTASGASFCSAPRRGAIGRAYGGPSSVFEFLFLGFGYWLGHRYRNRYRDRDRTKKKATGTIALPMAITTPISIAIPNSDTDLSAASAELICHNSKFHINLLQRAKTAAEQLNCST